MTTEARLGWGGEVQLSTDDTYGNCVELGEVRGVPTFPQVEADEHEVTHLKSPDRMKEFIAGLRDGGDMTVQLNYVPGGATDLLLTAAAETGDTRAIRIIIPDDSGTGNAAWVWKTFGWVKRYTPDDMQPNAPMTATLIIRITGAVDQQAETSESNS